MTSQMSKAGMVTLMLAALAVGGERGQLVGVGALPQEVLHSIDQAAGDVKWLVSFRFVDAQPNGDLTWYRVAGRDKQHSRLVKVMVQANGAIIDVRTEIPSAEVPPVALAALKRRLPNFQPTLAEAVGKNRDTPVYYLVVGMLGEEKQVYGVRADGANIEKLSK